MISIGIDVAIGKKIAIASLDEDGNLRTHLLPVPAGAGARRLTHIRKATRQAIKTRFATGCVVVVEIPWAPGGQSNFELLAATGVVLEAAQDALAGAIVMEIPTARWKLHSVGQAVASKDKCIEHAQGLGYTGEDSDVADAVCMADCGWSLWAKHTKRAA